MASLPLDRCGFLTVASYGSQNVARLIPRGQAIRRNTPLLPPLTMQKWQMQGNARRTAESPGWVPRGFSLKPNEAALRGVDR
jgi:hypothetical protein